MHGVHGNLFKNTKKIKKESFKKCMGPGVSINLTKKTNFPAFLI